MPDNGKEQINEIALLKTITEEIHTLRMIR